MNKPILITVKGDDSRGGDAPTVEDLVAQIQDFVFVLHEVEEAIAQDNKKEIVWRVTDVTKNSPLKFEVTPYPKSHAMNIESRAEEVVSATAKGLKRLSDTGNRPMYFTDKAIDKAVKVYGRVKNGLASTLVDFSKYKDAPNFEVTPEIAHRSIDRIERAKVCAPIAHKELGSLEGYITKIELDGFGRRLVWLRSRLDGQVVKCISGANGLDRIGHFEVSEVLEGLRIRVHGIINYKGLEQISTIDVEGVHVFEPDEGLPNFDSIVSPDFTNGLEASAYLEALRQYD